MRPHYTDAVHESSTPADPRVQPVTTEPVRLRLLGPVSVLRGGVGNPPPLTAPRRLAVLCYLAIARPAGMHARETLATLFWPESDPESARHALRNVLHAIRRALGDDVLVSAGDGLVGVNAARLDCDVRALRADLDGERVEEALARYQGELLHGFHISDAPEFERWLDAERLRLRNDLLDAARCRISACRLAGDIEGALTVARRATDLAPDDERSLRQLLDLLGDAGDRAAAEDAFDQFRRRVAREYDAEPAPETVSLMERLRARRDAGALPRAAPARQLVDPGAYVLYVRGTYIFLRNAPGGDPRELNRCRDFFEQALARDPNFAHAYSGLANYYAVAAVRNVLAPFAETFARAIALSHRALSLDPGQAIPHVHFGVKAMYLDGDWDTAGVEFGTAVSLDPTYAEARRFHGIYLGAVGRTAEAIGEFREAVRAEPHLALFRNTLAAAYMDLRRYDDAVTELQQALALDLSYGAARNRLIQCFERMGRYDAAVAERKQSRHAADALRFANALDRDGERGYRRERAVELRALIASVASTLTDGPPENAAEILNPPQLRLALACAELGEWDRARAWVEHACSRRPGQRPWFASHPDLAPLHKSTQVLSAKR